MGKRSHRNTNAALREPEKGIDYITLCRFKRAAGEFNKVALLASSTVETHLACA